MKVLVRAVKLLLIVGMLALPADMIAQSKTGPPFKPMPNTDLRGKRVLVDRELTRMVIPFGLG